MPSATFNASGTWTVPAGVTTVRLQAWAESGKGGTGVTGGGGFSGGGGGGGEYAEEAALDVTGLTSVTFTIGAGGTGTNTVFAGTSVTVTAHHGGNAVNTTRGAAGSGSTNTIHFSGGTGGNGSSATDPAGGGGGGSGGSSGAGGTGGTGGSNVAGAAGGTAGTGGGATGGQGGSGSALNVPGFAGGAPGAGPGGGSGRTGGTTPGAPAAGRIIITFSATPIPGAMALSGVGVFSGTGRVAGTISGAAALSGTGTFTASSGISGGGVVNQWALSYSQPGSFQTTLPALQSAVVGLNPSYQVAPGTGTPTAGNWLFAIAGWNQDGLPPVTAGFSDDIHSFWRPGQVVTASWPGNTPSGIPGVSPAAGNTRTAIWYTPNIARAPQWVYAAPSGAMAALSVLVIEVSGLSPWDTVTGIYANFADAATALSLTLGAPSSTGYFVAAVTGDNTSAGQSFLPSGWLPLATVSATNGTDHTCDAELTAAVLTTSGSVSASASATSATDLSGVVIGVLASASSPVPAGQNPNWPYMKLEAAFGSGFQTPPDQMVWTDLTSRSWSWEETTGIQFQLGQIQATDLNLELDDFDANLASDRPGALYYSNALNQNMSFQSGTSPWSAAGNAALAQSSANTYASSPGAAATYSLSVTPNGATAGPGAVSERVHVTAGATYSTSGWFYSPAGWGSGATMALSWYNSGGSLISSQTSATVPLPAATWTAVPYTGQTAPSSAVTCTITPALHGTPTAAPFYVAEAALAAGPATVATGLITTGIPVRLRGALGTLGGVTSDRWYVIQRNAHMWPQKIDELFRRNIESTGTDIWSVMSATDTTPYRGEITQDSPYAWWPCDDQPLENGVQPVSLLNAAPGNSIPLSIIASPSGVSAASAYSTSGTNLTSTGTASTKPPLPSVATAQAGQQQGWMYGDPLAQPAYTPTGNTVTATPGAAAWQQSGLLGNSGAQTWFLAVNDASFPPLSAGITVKGWFNAGFFGSATGYTAPSNSKYNVAAQPVSQITIATLSTGSAPVAILYLDTSGHLILQTFVGTTGTTHSIYTGSDLRSGSWTCVDVQLTQTTWQVLVNGGLTASVSGTMSSATSAWTWLTLNGDYGTAGGSSPSSIQHGGNVAYSHWTVFASQLPAWRLRAHYAAAITGFGLLPAPQNLSLSAVANQLAGQGYVPDGSEFNGSYGSSGGNSSAYAMSAVAVAQAGPYTSAPAARTVSAGYGTDNGGIFYGDAVWLALTALAPSVILYTAPSADSETGAAVICGSGDSFTSGYGSSASGHGVCQIAAGSGASPPASASALGDTVQQRIERILTYATFTSPQRSIDPAALLVQAAIDIGGQQAASNLQNIASSDDGLLYIDNLGNLTYWQRSHLASQYASPVWDVTPAAGAGQVPYYREINWLADPQRIWNAIAISPFSPDPATLLPLITPSAAAQVLASQKQFGAQPLEVTSYLQSTSEMQNQANWLFQEYGSLHVRAEGVKIDAAPYPAAFQLVMGINVGDVVTAQNWQVGGGGVTWTFRVSSIRRTIRFGHQGSTPEAAVTLKLDWEPPSYWT